MGRKAPTQPPYKPGDKVVRPAPPPRPPKKGKMMATVIRKDDKPNEIALTVTVDSSALDQVEEKLLRIASLAKRAQLSEPLVLTQKQIKELARFAAEDAQPSYTITTGVIPAFEADDGEMVAEFNGLIAYSDSEEHSVLQLG